MQELSGRLPSLGDHQIAWRRTPGKGPTVVWLGGFHSDMTGSKAAALAGWAEARGRDYLRFDYFGHGASSGDFGDGTIGRWRDDTLLVLDRLTEGPVILVGSSMGGWIACLAAMARPERVGAMVLVAPAADFTDKLIWPQLAAEARMAIETTGEWIRRSDYDPQGYPITRALIEDGSHWSILGAPVAISVPVRILQGQRDPDVPWAHALRLADAIAGEDVTFTLVKDGDHSLSRPQDLARLLAAVDAIAG